MRDEELVLRWEFSPNGSKWFPFDVSVHDLYVLADNGAPSPFICRESLVRRSCESAREAADSVTVAKTIFEGMFQNELGGGGPTTDGVRRKAYDGYGVEDNRVLVYYDPNEVPPSPLEPADCETWIQLLESAEDPVIGKCGAFAQLLHRCLVLHGVDAEIHEILPPAAAAAQATSLLVKDWSFATSIATPTSGAAFYQQPPSSDDEWTDPSTLPGSQPYVFPGGNGMLDSAIVAPDQEVSGYYDFLGGPPVPGFPYRLRSFYAYFWDVPSWGIPAGDCVDIGDAPGQGNPNPPPLFGNHYVVYWQNPLPAGGPGPEDDDLTPYRVFDPSYGLLVEGVGMEEVFAAYEDLALSGFGAELSGEFFGRKNDPGTLEISNIRRELMETQP